MAIFLGCPNKGEYFAKRESMTEKYFAVVMVVVLLGVFGCGAAPEPAPEPVPGGNADVVEQASAVETAPVERGGDFAFRLYRELLSKDENLFFSPLSLEFALGMVYAGARGETEGGMSKALDFPMPQGALHDEMSIVLAAFEGNEGVEVSAANALWPSKGYPFDEGYQTLIKDKYAAAVTPLDYGKTKKAIKAINGWTSENTKGKIEEIVNASNVGPGTLMVLTNAIYFKGPWQNKFDPEVTRKHEFRRLDGQKTEVEMMSRTFKVGYFMDENVKVVALPYGEGRYEMLVVLPAADDGLLALEKDLSTEMFEQWREKFNRGRVNVNRPKFKLESEFKLKEALVKLGMADAFSSAADFSGMTGSSSGLHLQQVVHKAVVEVEEQGTEAAAATAGMMTISLPPRFVPDHPFLFVIRDNKQNKTLFIGRVVDPE